MGSDFKYRITFADVSWNDHRASYAGRNLDKLDRVQKNIEAIREALGDDRMQSLRAAIEGVNGALEARSPENKNALMTAFIPELQRAIHQSIAALRREIAEVPIPKKSKAIRLISNREPLMRSNLMKAERTFRACLEGILTLSQAYFTIDEREIGCRAAIRLFSELQRAGIDEAEFKARLITPSDREDRPEELWGDFRRLVPEMIELIRLEEMRTDEDTAEIDVELLPVEIESTYGTIPRLHHALLRARKINPAGCLSCKGIPNRSQSVVSDFDT